MKRSAALALRLCAANCTFQSEEGRDKDKKGVRKGGEKMVGGKEWRGRLSVGDREGDGDEGDVKRREYKE